MDCSRPTRRSAGLRLGAVRLTATPTGSATARCGEDGSASSSDPALRRLLALIDAEAAADWPSVGPRCAATLPDQSARDGSPARPRTLFVEAGAGSGKTQRWSTGSSALVLDDGVPLRRIAAVTFTEKAGAELRDRLRAEFEKERATADGSGRARAEALDDLDGAAIGTLHSFAQRILEHPIEAGLPPLIEVLDEVGSSVAFEDRWAELRDRAARRRHVAEPLLLGDGGRGQAGPPALAGELLGNDWDLIDDGCSSRPARAGCNCRTLADSCRHGAAALAALASQCTDADDKLLR